MEGSHAGGDPHDDPIAEMSLDTYRCWDDGRRARVPLVNDGGQMGPKIDARSFDGDKLPWRVARLRSRNE